MHGNVCLKTPKMFHICDTFKEQNQLGNDIFLKNPHFPSQNAMYACNPGERKIEMKTSKEKDENFEMRMKDNLLDLQIFCIQIHQFSSKVVALCR